MLCLLADELGGIHLEGLGQFADGARMRLLYAPGLELQDCGGTQAGLCGELPLRQ